jgi:hypothetical protein
MGKNGNVLPYINTTLAAFYKGTTNTNAKFITNFGNAGTVSINDSVISFKGRGYVDTTFMKYKTPVTWKVSGSDLFPAFSFTNTDSTPVYTGYNLLPDTIYNNGQDIIYYLKEILIAWVLQL